MKLEMGESLFYSWLRHVKECQVVQLNWKPSPSWEMQSVEELERIMEITDEFFQDKYGYGIYKNNTLSQLLRQAEVDALGVSMSDNETEIYAVDVAFHESGLNYGSRQETVERVVKKLIRTFLCMKAYFKITKGELIFASPKIHNAVLNDLEPCLNDFNSLLMQNNHNFRARVIANDDFDMHVLRPILLVSDGVSDTSELFMRGYQLINMFVDTSNVTKTSESSQVKSRKTRVPRLTTPQPMPTDVLAELKIGKIAQIYLRKALEEGKADEEEVVLMQTRDYSKQRFGIDFPLLVSLDADFDTVRYYSTPLNIRGKQYRLCSQWFEVPANNDRPYLLAWLEERECI